MSDETPQTSENSRGRLWLRGFVALAFGLLLVGDVAMYSSYQALRSRVETQDHRIERLQSMVTDMIKGSQNAQKIEKIETQVDAIGVQVTDLSTTLKAETKAEAEEPSKKKKKRR